MKNLIILLALITGLTASSTPYAVDTSTPSVISGVTHYGDIFPVPWNKMNSNSVFFATWLTNLNAGLITVSNTATSNTVSFALVNLQTGTNTTAISNLTVLVNSLTNRVANSVTNTGTGYTLTGTWYGDGTWLALNGTNLASGTVNTNALDAATLAWLQTMPTPGANLLDNANSAGSAGQVPLANGDGTWTWQTTNAPPAIIIQDTGGMGGTTLMLNAQDNGTPMYLHITSLGVVTATGSP
jgi:hypothetical protein